MTDTHKDGDIELKPCPFCGGETEYSEFNNAVQCSYCYALGAWSYEKETALKEWNTRAPLSNTGDSE